MKIEAKIVPDEGIRKRIEMTDGKEELLALARESYLCFDHFALKTCIDKYEGLYRDGGAKEFRWLMETSCW